MKRMKKIAMIGFATLALLYNTAKADFFDGCRPPKQYNVQIDARYVGKNFVLIPKVFGKKWYGFAATNLSAEKIRPYIGTGPIINTLEGKLHMMPTLEFDTDSKKFNFTNYTTATLAKGKINIDNVVTLAHNGKIIGDISAGVDVYKGLRIGVLKSLNNKDTALRIWYNPPNVKYILGLKVAQDEVMLNGRIHF